MNINRNYISTQNTYVNNNPRYIVVHNTDNFSAGANAQAHAKAQHNGNFSGMSAHYYVDDGITVYQAADHSRGTWHVGKNYGGGRFFGAVSNRNSIGIEMCVQKGYDYEKAFQNTAALVRHLMAQTGIPADRVLQHYDVCAKNCPSQIRKRGDWNRFKSLISGGTVSKPNPEPVQDWKPTGTATCGGNSVNVRQPPNGSVLLQLNKGNRFEINGETSGSWTKIKANNTVGWMAMQYVVLDQPAPKATAKPKAAGKIMIKADGVWGSNTTKRLQQYFGLVQDGKISNQLNSYKKYCPGIVSAEWSDTPNGGSMLVRKMQHWLEIKQDGYIGPEFIKKLQAKMGKGQDGVLSNPSRCITAFQHWLNEQ